MERDLGRGVEGEPWAGVLGRGYGGPLVPACAAPQDLFFHYTFNNFLHAQVELCVRAVLSTGSPSDSSLEIPAPNPAVKHVRWGSQIPLPVPVGPHSSPCPAAGACQAASRVGGPGVQPCP